MALENDIFELLKSNNFRRRTAMYIGYKRISCLKSFLDGCFYAQSNNAKWFEGFNDWVTQYYGWRESTAGWANIILNECEEDEEAALEEFFRVFDLFIEKKSK